VAVVERADRPLLRHGIVPKPVGNRHATATPFDLFDTRDGGIVIAVQKNTMFASLCKALGCPELIDDSRFTSNAERCIYQEESRGCLRISSSPRPPRSGWISWWTRASPADR
jgi:CoA:oxalate CoA-transferase